MRPRLRLVPTNPEPSADQLAHMALRGALDTLFACRGYTDTKLAVGRHLERLAKANRAALAQQGWIA